MEIDEGDYGNEEQQAFILSIQPLLSPFFNELLGSSQNSILPFLPSSSRLLNVNDFPLSPNIYYYTPTSLPSKFMDPLWNILEENMKQLAESSNAGWHPDETRLELFSLPQSHYIVAVSRVADDNAGIVEQPIAFIQFRFLVENEEIVCYMYELQSSREYRRCGIGRALHSILEQLCRHVKVKKIMLTVFLSNITALSFYYSLNYQRDPFSPLYVDEEESEDEEIDCDYDILSFIVPD